MSRISFRFEPDGRGSSALNPHQAERLDNRAGGWPGDWFGLDLSRLGAVDPCRAIDGRDTHPGHALRDFPNSRILFKVS